MSQLNKIIENVATTPGASWRPEELLFRFDVDDKGNTVIKGAHVTILVSEPDHDGTTARTVYGPFPVTALASDPVLRELLGKVQVAQQATIDSQVADIAAHKAENAALQKKIDHHVRSVAALESRLAERGHQAKREHGA
jgi:hypothetical protein